MPDATSPAADAPADDKPGTKRGPPDAFAQLMARKKPHSEPPPPPKKSPAHWRAGQGPDALGAYIADPASPRHPPGAVVFYDDHFVAVRDRFPKAAVHCLLLPREPAEYISAEHPLELLSRAGSDKEVAAFLERLQQAAHRLARLVAADLQRQFGPHSAADAARQAAMRQGDELPPGRDWTKDVLVGLHARPSMAHLHVHVLSRDMHGAALRHRKHYNSFTTPFFVPLAALPLAEEEAKNTTPDDYLRSDLVCWRCGRRFGNRFAELKRHLDVEFDAWKKE